MRRGTYENHWDKGPENWVNHNQRFPRGNRRPNFHGFNTRTPTPRWRCDGNFRADGNFRPDDNFRPESNFRSEGNFRPRGPAWNPSFPSPQQFSQHNVHSHTPPGNSHPPHGPLGPPRQPIWWGPTNSLLPAPMDNLYHYLKPKPPQSVGLPCDNLNDTINTVKQKLRERKVSETNVDHMGSPVSDFPDDGVAVKASERRRIEHTKLPNKPASIKKMDRKETNTCRVARLPSTQHSPTSTYQKKTELMRRKILKQLFRMDNPTMRKIVNQPMSSSKYDFALNSLIKETRISVSNQLRSLAEKSLSFHATNADSLQGKQIVQDTFMGHLGTMLDIDASVELSNMEPQVIAELSKVLQEDLMGNLNEEMSTSFANAVQDSVSEDVYSSTLDFPNYLIEDQGVQSNTFGYNTSGNAYFHGNSSSLPLENTTFSNDRNTNKTADTHCTERVDCFPQSVNNFGSKSYSELEGITNDAYDNANFQRRYSGSKMKTYGRKNESNSPSQYLPCDNPEVGENRYSHPRSAYNSQHVKAEDRTRNDSHSSNLADTWASVDYQPSHETIRDELFPNGSHFPPHSKSPLNAALNNNCDSLSCESAIKTDTSSNVVPLMPAMCPKPATIITVSAATSNLESNLRKRKISDSHSTPNSNKKPDISECGISVRKDIFPEDPNLDPLNAENNSCDISITSSENISQPLLSKPSPESCEKLTYSLPPPEKLVKSSDEKQSDFFPESPPKFLSENLTKTSSEQLSKSSIQKMSKPSCEKVPKTSSDKLSCSSPERLSKSPPEKLAKESKVKLSTLSPEQSKNPPPVKLSKSHKEKLPEQSTKSFSELISSSSQTRCIILRSQSSQYIPAILRSSDASSQVYESLICSKSKGVQCAKPSARDRSCQTLKVGSLSPAFHTDINKTDHLCHRETQTDEIFSVVKTETISVSSDKEIVKISKIKPLEKFRSLEQNCKPEEVLEKMRQIDNDIQQLMEEKLKLYNMLDVPSAGMDTNPSLPSSASSSNVKGKHLEKLRFQKYDRELQKRNHNHSKSVDKPILKCSPIHNASRILKPRSSKDKASTSDTSSNHQKRNTPQGEHYKTKEPHSKHKNSNEIKSSSDDHKNVSNEHKNNSHEYKNKNVSNSALKSKSKPIPPRSDRSKHSIKKNISDKPEVEYSNCSANNIIPGKDINNCKSDLVKGQVDLCNNVAPEAGNALGSLEVNSDTKYVDAAGCPLPLDCNFVVFEEIVIKSEDDPVNDPSSSGYSPIISKIKKKPDVHKKNRTLRSGNSCSKLDKSDCDKVAVKPSITKLPSALPIIKIRRKRTSSTSSQSPNKASPLFNLISQLNDTDEECDFEISPQKGSKPSMQTSNKSECTEPTGTDLGALEVSSADCTPDTEENPKYDLVDCRVYLERFDATKIVTPVHESKVITNSNNVCAPLKDFEESYDPTIMNDETLFVSKGYGNDDDCISLEQLDAVQFDDFCDPDGPSIIGNIQVNDSFSIIDQWDSKLFEDVSLLEDREIFSDKNLMDGLSTNTEPDNSSQEKSNSTQSEGNAFRPINCTSHTDSIIALKCVGDNFLAASLDGNVYYYCGLTGTVLKTTDVSQLAVTCLIIKPGKPSSLVYTGSLDSTLRCFNFQTGQKEQKDIDVGGAIQTMFLEWKTLYIGTQTGFVVQFDIEKGAVLPERTLKFSDNSILALHAIKEGPRKVLLIASRSQEVTVKDAATGLLLRSFHGPNNTVYSLLFDLGKVYCGTSGAEVQVFDFASGDIVGTHKGGRGAVCLQMYRGLLFTGCYDGVIYVFKKSDCNNPVASMPGPGKMLLAMAIVNNKIIAGCKDKSLCVWPLPKEITSLFES